MLFVIHCQIGEGFAQKMEPVLRDKYTLYIGPKPRFHHLNEIWVNWDVDFTSFYKLPETLAGYDQVIVEELLINPRMQRVQRLVKLLQTNHMKPIFFRPAYGRSFDHIILDEHIQRF